MKLLIIGATGGTGRELVEQALARGQDVTAFVRNPSKIHIKHERRAAVQGDVLDYQPVEAAVQGKDAVLSALGYNRWFVKTTILSDGTKNIMLKQLTDDTYLHKTPATAN